MTADRLEKGEEAGGDHDNDQQKAEGRWAESMVLVANWMLDCTAFQFALLEVCVTSLIATYV